MERLDQLRAHRVAAASRADQRIPDPRRRATYRHLDCRQRGDELQHQPQRGRHKFLGRRAVSGATGASNTITSGVVNGLWYIAGVQAVNDKGAGGLDQLRFRRPHLLARPGGEPERGTLRHGHIRDLDGAGE